MKKKITSFFRFVLSAAGFGYLLYMFAPPVQEYFLPAREAGLRVIAEEGDVAVSKHAGQVQDKYFQLAKYETADGKINLDRWAETAFPAADEVAKARRLAAAADDRARGVRSTVTDQVLPGRRDHWQFARPLHESMWITCEGSIASSENSTEISDCNGIYAEGLPGIRKNEFQVWKKKPYRRFIGQICPGTNPDDPGCQMVDLGSLALLCNPDGNLFVWINETIGDYTGSSHTLIQFTNNEGSLSWDARSEFRGLKAADMCNKK